VDESPGAPHMTGATPITARFRQTFENFTLNVDIDFPARGVSAVFGPSGSGKTTLLRCIAGLQRCANGYLRMGDDVWQDEAAKVFTPVHRRPLGFVFQEANLFSHLTVLQNLEFGRSRVPVAQQKLPLEQAIDLLGLSSLLHRQTAALSGGERQRVGIARALATCPRVLLMDEPLASLDAQRKADVLPYLERLAAELEVPIIYVSHALDEVARLADHLVLLDAGQVVATGAAGDVMTRLELPLAHGDAAASIIDAVVSSVEPQYFLSYASFAGGQISLINSLKKVGQVVRVRVQARDVSISLLNPASTSVQNIFAATVVSVADDSPGQAMVALDVGGTRLLARLTQKSVDALALAPGQPVFAQVKGVAVLR
jgi:molybdate transport system ATP-binding protein